MSISVNIPSSTLVARHSAMKAEQATTQAIERLATGSKINAAGDDAAGLAIAQRHNANILGLAGAAKNSADTQSVLAMADASLSGVSSILIRMNDLAAAAGNSALGSQELEMIQNEVDQLMMEINATANRTSFNDAPLFDGTFKNQRSLVGAHDGAGITFSLPNISTQTLGAYVFYADGVAPSAAATSAANNPVTTAEDVTIRGSIGTYRFNATSQESAQDLAARINAQSESTGVSTQATTEALLASGSASDESVRLLINGVATGAFSFSSTNYTDAIDAINAISSSSGVSAEGSDVGIRLVNLEGIDITIENMNSSVNLSVRKIAANGLNYVGQAVALEASGDNDSTRISGTLMLSSSESFGVSEAGATATENIVIQSDTAIAQTAGVVSIVDGFIYVGNGSDADAIGAIDPILDGQSGQQLKINLGQFGNNDFETGNAGDTTVSGWSISNTHIKLNGASLLGGQATATDNSFPANTATGYAAPYDQMTPSSASYNTNLSTNTSSGSGLSVRLQSTGITVDGYGIVHGPAIVSDSSVDLDPGDSVSFEWRASGGEDAYDVIGYLVDENTGHVEEILNETGADRSAATNWATVSRDITTSGSYKFVFVSGTWDATGGMAAGAQLFIDNISVTQNNKPPLTDNLIEQIRTALTSSRNGYLQPLSVVSNSNELLFTIEQSNVAQLIPINTLDLQARDGHTMARMLVANSLEQISSSRADVGALENRLDSVNDSALNIKQHLASAKSNYTDADYALESARLARSMLLQETSTSLLAKSNGLNEVVLDLLKDK
jgi:flagellin-like hook-associated protein FlgL